MAIQENDILSGRPLVMSFPNNTEFEEGITIFSSDKYFVDVANDNDVIIIAMRDVEDTVLATFYAYNTDTQTTVTNLSSYTLPDDFGIVNSIDTGSDAYQYITAIMGTPIVSDTLDMSTYGQAAKVATNYMTWSAEYGLVISEDATEDPSQMQGGNTRITSDGLDVYKGQNRVAHFGEEVILGDEESANAYLDPDTFKITNADGVDFFSVDMDGNPKETYVYVTGQRQSGSGSITTSVSETDDFASLIQTGEDVTVTFSWKIVYTWYKGSITVVKGTAKTEQVTINDIVVTISYDGNGNYTASCTFPFGCSYFLEIKGTIQSPAPSYTIGTRDGGTGGGAYSVTLGEGLTAYDEGQVVVGQYNEYSENKAFIVGVGTSSDLPRNTLTVDKYGNIWHYGDGSKSISVSKLSGANVESSSLLKHGKIVMLHMSLTNGTYSSGSNIFEGSITGSNSKYYPAFYTTASAYYGEHAIVGRINNQGKIIIRNASSSSISLTDTIDITFIYITPNYY